MYDLYPDAWGPAAHDPENPRSLENTAAALQTALDLRDSGGMRPDDRCGNLRVTNTGVKTLVSAASGVTREECFKAS